MCLAIVMESYAFDISPMREAYQEAFGAQTGVVNIKLPGGLTLDYAF